MGRPPSSGGPAFRFTQGEVAEMESYLQHVNNAVPAREAVNSFAEKFSASSERAGKIVVQAKQVWNWFQNRRYSQRTKVPKTPVKIPVAPARRDDPAPYTNVINSAPSASGKRISDSTPMEFEAKSIRDGAWYDVACFLSLRKMETGELEVRVRFGGFGVEEDEWINVRTCVRQRSLPCEPSECAVVLPGDLILCFQEGKEQALYFDAHILDAQRRRHDVRGCRCRFLVRYDHDQSEEIVPLKKICRRPETEYRMQVLFATKAIVPSVGPSTERNPLGASSGTDLNRAATQQIRKARKLDVNTDEVVLSPQMKEPQAVEGGVLPSAGNSSTTQVVTKSDTANTSGSCEITQQ